MPWSSRRTAALSRSPRTAQSLAGCGDRALEHDILWSSYRYGTGAYSRSGVVCQEGERLVRYFVDCGDSGICELWLDRRRVLPVEEEQLLDRFTGMA